MEREMRTRIVRAIRLKRRERQAQETQPDHSSLLRTSDALTTVRYPTSAVVGIHAAALVVQLLKKTESSS